MKVARSICVFLAIMCIVQAVPASPKSRNPPSVRGAGHSSAGLKLEFAVWSATERRFSNYRGDNIHEGPDPIAPGIREDIPEKYLKRYQDWKKEFLSTQTGHRQWQTYAQSTNFLLTITFNRGNRNGGETEYKWNGSGRLVAATITLGSKLDRGYPNPIYYPVMNSLSQQSSYTVSGNTLAATKLAHEFGHVIRMMATDPALYRLQNQLIPAYNQMAATPTIQDSLIWHTGWAVRRLISGQIESTGARRMRCFSCATASQRTPSSALSSIESRGPSNSTPGITLNGLS
jgi:YD repeat-containing protein